jgi:integrase
LPAIRAAAITNTDVMRIWAWVAVLVRGRSKPEPLVRAAGLPWIGLHGLRHTHATMALQAGVPAKVVQERLGHSSVKITLDTYSHVLPNMQRDAAERVAELIFGS